VGHDFPAAAEADARPAAVEPESESTDDGVSADVGEGDGEQE